MNVHELPGTDLGTHEVAYDDRDVILYALTTGAGESDLDLVYERNLRTLPTFGLTLALWVVEAAGALGAYDPLVSLHAQQQLLVHRRLPPQSTFPITGRVTGVWDKGSAALIDIDASCTYFTATYSIFVPGLGGWGGERGPATGPATRPLGAGDAVTRTVGTATNHALLYRLTGDRHPIHVDHQVAKEAGFTRPILHGLCTLGLSVNEVARALGRHPADLRSVQARFAAPVHPGDSLQVETVAGTGGRADFSVSVADSTVLKAGSAGFDAA